MTHQHWQVEDGYVHIKREKVYGKIETKESSSLQQIMNTNIKTTNGYNNRKMPVIDNHRSEQRISRGEEGLRTSAAAAEANENADSGKKNINNNNPSNRSTQYKILPYKRNNRKLFVGGLPAGLTGDEFRGIFEKFGTILDSVIIMNRNTKRSRGFGFVTFEDPRIALKVLHSGNAEKRGGKQDGSLSHQTTEKMGTSKDADTAVGLSGSIYIRGKRCEIKASVPKETNSSPPSIGQNSNSGVQPLHSHRSSLEGNSNIESHNNYDEALFDRAIPPNTYSTPPPSYPYDVHHGQIRPAGVFFQCPTYNRLNSYAGSNEEHMPPHAQVFGIDGSTYNDANVYNEISNDEETLSPYARPFGIRDGGGMTTYHDGMSYPPQSFAYGNGGVLYVPQTDFSHTYSYGNMHPQTLVWPFETMSMPASSPRVYTCENEQFENSASGVEET